MISFFVTVISAQTIDVEKKVTNEANQRANQKTDEAIDKTFDKIEEGIGSLFGKKKKKKKKEQPEKVNASMQTNSQTSNTDFGAFSEMFPANGGVIAYPPFVDWEIPNESDYIFTVRLKGDDWPEPLIKTTSKKTNMAFDQLPTNTTNFKWQVIAEGNGQRLESPWQSFTTTDGTGGDLAANKSETPQINLQWSKFDFVPGDEVIFEDAPSAEEENGEFPSRWDLVKGQTEIANLNGENVIMFADGNPEIIPYLKNSSDDYLPDVFTIEFDFYRPAKGNRISVYLFDRKNQNRAAPNMYIDIDYNQIDDELTEARGEHPDIDYKWNEKGRWIHISIAFTKGKLKVYMDDTRLINVPHYEGNPTGLSLQAYWADLGEDKAFYFKNIRIAKGGVKYYDRVLSEGKIIVNGIRFDVNKATIKPESMGAINEIFSLMQKQPELNFSVEGHTDSDGDDQLNQTLSEQRAKAVMDRLIEMGISSSRLKSAGWGESKPISDNSTAEGKANNRRVEFVKF